MTIGTVLLAFFTVPIAAQHDNVDLQSQHLCCELGETLVLALSKPPLDGKIFSFAIAKLPHASRKTCTGDSHSGGCRRTAQESNPPDFASRLAARSDWPRHRPTQLAQ
jgi:hypothetical protein